jgi:RNA polymerase sigma-70 factor (sigma-E family)
LSPELERQFVEYVSGRLPRLHRTAYLLCGDSTRADDLVQSTITSLYLAWPRALAADNIDGYVHRILVRRHVDDRRRAWSRVLLLQRTPDRAASPPPSVEDAHAVQAALARLPAGQRAVLVLRFFSDLSVEETAAALGCSEGNVKSQTSRGLAALRRLLGEPNHTSEFVRS